MKATKPSANPPSTVDGVRSVLLLALLCLPLLATLSGQRYIWTDTDEIARGALVRTTVSGLMSALVHGSREHYYRPTVIVLHTVDYWLFGDRLRAFQATNLLLHFLNVVLLFKAVLLISGRRLTSLTTAGLFAIHPLVVTPIMWISDRTDLVALGSSLGFFLSIFKYRNTGRRGFVVAAGAILLIGLGAKESVAATTLVSATVLAIAGRDERRRLAFPFLVQCLIIVLWFLWRHHIQTASPVAPGHLPLVTRGALSLPIHVNYLLEFIDPGRLSVCAVAHMPGRPALAVATECVLVGTVGAWAWSRWRTAERSYLLAASWIVSFLLPTSGLVPLTHICGDRYLYMALPACLYVVVACVFNIMSRPQLAARRWLPWGVFIPIYVFLSRSLLERTRHFVSDDALWSHEVELDDECLEGHSYLSRTAYDRGDDAEALRHIERILRTPPPGVVAFVDQGKTHYYRGLILLHEGHLPEARGEFEVLMAANIQPTIRSEAAYSFALTELVERDYEGMDRHLQLAQLYGAPEGSLADVTLLQSYAKMQLRDTDSCRRFLAQYVRMREVGTSPLRRALLSEISAFLGPAARREP